MFSVIFIIMLLLFGKNQNFGLRPSGNHLQHLPYSFPDSETFISHNFRDFQRWRELKPLKRVSERHESVGLTLYFIKKGQGTKKVEKQCSSW